MKPKARLTGVDAPSRLARRLEADMETGQTPRLEGRFKDHRDISQPRTEIGDLRVKPRPEPSVRRSRSR
jgi:hypothetical protein